MELASITYFTIVILQTRLHHSLSNNVLVNTKKIPSLKILENNIYSNIYLEKSKIRALKFMVEHLNCILGPPNLGRVAGPPPPSSPRIR